MRPVTRSILSVFLFAVPVFLAIRYLLPLLMPFLLGLALALMAEPAVRLLHAKCRLPRSVAAGIGVSGAFAIICTLLTMLFTFLFKELGILAGILPDMEGTVMQGLEALRLWLVQMAGHTPDSVKPVLERNVNDLFSGGTALLDRFTRYALGLAGTILGHLPDSALGLGTAVLSAFLISSKLPQIRAFVSTVISRRRLRAILDAIHAFRTTALLWLTAELKLTGVTCLLLTAGFLLLKISHAPLWALAVGAVDAFPILGTGTVLVPWSIVCLLQQNTPRALGLLGLYAAVSLTRSVLEPRFVGRELGLDPLVTLIALYMGFRLWGFAGMLLAPMVAITAIRMTQPPEG